MSKRGALAVFVSGVVVGVGVSGVARSDRLSGVAVPTTHANGAGMAAPAAVTPGALTMPARGGLYGMGVDPGVMPTARPSGGGG